MNLSPEVLTQLQETIQESPLDSAAQDRLLSQVNQLSSEAELKQLLNELTEALETVTETEEDANEFPLHTKPAITTLILRPGHAIPANGIAPAMVFRTPPESPPPANADSCENDIAPPEPGTPVTPEMGYSAEDLQVLEKVGDYRFGDVLNQGTIDTSLFPDTKIEFDREAFMRGLRHSISLSGEEKFRIIASLPQLSSFQIFSLVKILDTELSKFRSLSPSHLLQLREREHRFLLDWEDIVIRGLRMSRRQTKPMPSELRLVEPAACD